MKIKIKEVYLRFNKIISFLYRVHLKVKLASFSFLHGIYVKYGTCVSLVSLLMISA